MTPVTTLAMPETLPLSDGPALRVEGVSVWLSGREVLHEVSFSLAPGELAGLIGSNGAGKTTLLRAILGFQRISAGRVVAPRPIGYVPQKVLLDPDLPVRAKDLVELGLEGRQLGLPWLSHARRQARVQELLASVGATGLGDARVGTLSGGEQQKILIAHALARGPKLLLLDEPMASLDLRATQEVVELLGRIAKDYGVAVLLSTHDMNPLLRVMDRVVYLAGGRAASGTTDEVVRSDVLSRLYGHHVCVVRIHGRVLISSTDEHGEEGCDVAGDDWAAATRSAEPARAL
ncbi:MAG: metal ABC transporter ATP-binding protein [Acidimicrobiales bacterium]